MKSGSAKTDLRLALTQSDLGKIPPELRVATGYDDEVMLFLLRVTDPDATAQVLMGFITLSESKSIVAALKTTRGLIRKSFHIDDAVRIIDLLASIGTDVQLVMPTS